MVTTLPGMLLAPPQVTRLSTKIR